MLAHNVYFTLKEHTPEARQRLVAACRKYLTGHPGTLFFACGTREERLQRPVNDRDFDVALHLVFDSKESHDTYQDSARHVAFVEENRASWEKARVFDSTVEGAE
jgi:hypothetical protein